MQFIIDRQLVTLLKDRDEYGRNVIFVRTDNFDFSRIGATEIFRFTGILLESLLTEEITQVTGITFVIDCKAVDMKFFQNFPVEDFKQMIVAAQDASGFRIRAIYVINLPSWTTAIVELIMKIVKEKIRKRICFIKSLEEFHKKLSPTILPESFGGRVPESELIENFKHNVLSVREQIFEFDATKTSFKPESDGFECIGSFRKLDFD